METTHDEAPAYMEKLSRNHRDTKIPTSYTELQSSQYFTVIQHFSLAGWDNTTRSLAVAKRPCDCCVGQFSPNVTGRRYFADIIGLSSTTVTYSGSNNIEFSEITQNKGYYAVQGHSRSVTDVDTNRKPVYEFLLVINTNWYITSYTVSKLSQIIV